MLVVSSSSLLLLLLVDILVQVFDNLHTSLKIDMVTTTIYIAVHHIQFHYIKTREFFIMYGGMSILLSHLRTENYLVCGCVLNIVLSLTDESSGISTCVTMVTMGYSYNYY